MPPASRSGVTVTLEPSISGSGSRVMVTKAIVGHQRLRLAVRQGQAAGKELYEGLICPDGFGISFTNFIHHHHP